MTYRLTDEQQAAIRDVDILCGRVGLPQYSVIVNALAGLAVAGRDKKLPSAARLTLAFAALEGLRNESAAPKAVTSPGL